MRGTLPVKISVSPVMTINGKQGDVLKGGYSLLVR